MAAAEVKEKVLFLPQKIVQKSVGFSLDVGKNIRVFLSVCLSVCLSISLYAFLFVGIFLVCWVILVFSLFSKGSTVPKQFRSGYRLKPIQLQKLALFSFLCI